MKKGGMFTGIIEGSGTIRQVVQSGFGKRLAIEADSSETIRQCPKRKNLLICGF